MFLALLPPQTRLVWDVALYTGLRVSDIIKLKYPARLRFDIIEQKTKKRRTVYLSPSLVQRLNIMSNYGWLFPSRSHRGQHITRSTVTKNIRKCALKCGLDNVGIHSARKMYALSLYESTHDLSQVQQALNHANLATTLIYLFAQSKIEDDL